METNRHTGRSRYALFALIIFIAASAAYINSVGAQFHLDDFHQIVYNPNHKTFASIPRYFTTPSLGSYSYGTKGYDPDSGVPGVMTAYNYRPLTFATFTLNYAISALDVWSYHLFNIIMHALCSVLVFIIVFRVLRKDGCESSGEAVFAALLFAVHPIQTMAVTYISGRASLFAVFFLLAGFYLFIEYRESGRRSLLGFSAVCYLAGILFKETAATLPLLLIAYELTVGSGGPVRRRVMAYLPFAAAMAVYIVARKGFAGMFGLPVAGPSEAEYLVSQGRALLIYLRLFVFPVNQIADYYMKAGGAPGLREVVGLIVAAAIAYAAFYFRKKQPAVSFFMAWFLISMIPESGFPLLDVVFEHRMYLPSVGVFGVVAVAAFRLLGHRRAVIAAVSVVALMLVLTVSRNRVWATETSLWSDTVAKEPQSARAQAYLGRALVIDKRYSEAIPHLRTVIDNFPDYQEKSTVSLALGTALLETGSPDEALKYLKNVDADSPNYFATCQRLGEVFFEMGRYSEAVESFRVIAVEGNPAAYYNLGISLHMLGRHTEAVDALRKAIAAGADGYEARYYLALSCEKLGLRDEAVRNAEAAARMGGDDGGVAATELITRLAGRRR